MSERSPLRDKAFELWIASRGKRKLKDIAAELGIPAARLYKWKCEDCWNLKKKSRKYSRKPSGDSSDMEEGYKKMHGNTLALLGNKNAFKTGEYETIYFDALDEEEIEMLKNYNGDSLEKIERTIILYEIRERRMLKLLKELKEKQDEVEILNVYHYKPVKLTVDACDANGVKMQAETTVYNKYLKRTEEQHKPIINRIMDVENALTRVQEKKQNAINNKERILATNRLLDLKERKLALEEW